MTSNENKSFESRLGELENVVKILEKGDLTLEEAVESFEKGISISEECNLMLDQASLKVKTLVERAGKLVEEPFDQGSE